MCCMQRFLHLVYYFYVYYFFGFDLTFFKELQRTYYLLGQLFESARLYVLLSQCLSARPYVLVSQCPSVRSQCPSASSIRPSVSLSICPSVRASISMYSSIAVKKLRKSVNICQSYHKNKFFLVLIISQT